MKVPGGPSCLSRLLAVVATPWFVQLSSLVLSPACRDSCHLRSAPSENIKWEVPETGRKVYGTRHAEERGGISRVLLPGPRGRAAAPCPTPRPRSRPESLRSRRWSEGPWCHRGVPVPVSVTLIARASAAAQRYVPAPTTFTRFASWGPRVFPPRHKEGEYRAARASATETTVPSLLLQGLGAVFCFIVSMVVKLLLRLIDKLGAPGHDSRCVSG